MRRQLRPLPGTKQITTIAMVVAALLGAVPTSVSARHALPARPITWLAAGDSFSAGFGLAGSDWTHPPCTRASRAWPQLLETRARSMGYEFAPAHPRYVACPGAVVSQMQAGQLQGRSDLVTFSIGGNDAGFVQALASCLLARRVDFSWLNTRLASCAPDATVRATIDAAAGAVRALISQVANDYTTTGGNVVVVGYPAMFETPELWNLTAKLVGLCHGVDAEGARQIRNWAGHLNASIGEAVRAVNAIRPNGVSVTFVNVQDGKGNNPGHGRAQDVQTFANLYEPVGSTSRHNLCGTESWMNGLLDEYRTVVGPFHPNSLGQEAMSAVVAQAISNLDWTRLAAPGVPPTPPGDEVGSRPTPTRPPRDSIPGAPPKPTVANLDVQVDHQQPGHVGVSYDVGWEPGRDPVTCHFFIDGREVFTAQCGTHASKQFFGLSPGSHSFFATVTDRFGVQSEPTPTITREVPGSGPAPPPQPKPTIANFQVVVYEAEPGHVGVSYDVGWQQERDPVTCHFFIDGREVFTAQCGTHSSKQFYGISEGDHSFYATVTDRHGVRSEPSPTVVRHVPGQSTPEPKPTVSNFQVVIHGGGHVGVSYSVGWQQGRDPVTCHFFIDGREVFTAQCGTHSSKQFYGISKGNHSFHATVSDKYGVYSDPSPTVTRYVT